VATEGHPAPGSASKSKPIKTEFHFFGGKGGVGKTTCAAAFAIAAARAGARVLAVSTDPAHSLGDALGARLSSRVGQVPVDARRTLSAVEPDAPRTFGRWLADHGRALGDIVEHGTWLDRGDVDALLELSIPGVDELIGMMEIARLADARGGRNAYNTVVVDTAPTGHALRLFSSPAAVSAAAAVLEELQREHRYIREQLARVSRPEAADRLIALLSEQATTSAALLRDPSRVTVHWVMLPEPLSVAETDDALRELTASGIHVQELIVNRMMPDGPACPICDRRRAAERQVVANVRRSAGKALAIRVVNAESREPKGVRALARIGDRLIGARGAPLAPRRASPRGIAMSVPLTRRRPPDAAEVFGARELVFFGGKGGVGKTTAAAAAALALSRSQPDRRILLLSTDPAHSIGDVFDAAVGDNPRPIAGGPANLHVRELNAAAELAAKRSKIEAALEEILDAVGVGRGSASAGHGVSELMDLAPPGIDELVGLVGVIDARDRYDTIVVDTAPTGHALRLLEMPAAARAWIQVLLRVMLKYREVARPGALASELVEFSRQIRMLQDLLRDPARASFVVVTRAAEVPRRETERLMRQLRRLRIASPVVIANALTLWPRRCPWCRTTAAGEKRELARFRRHCRRCVIIQTPLAQPPPRGVAAIEEWAGTWIA
jgi:arsenite/tail-anchored protein-transporting ATPase